MITLSDGDTTLTLDPDLYWEDEYSWAATEQTVTRSLTGKPIIQLGQRIAGRPITLRPHSDTSAWMPLSTLAQLQRWADVPGQQLTLTLRGTAYPVLYRHQDVAHEAAPLVHYRSPEQATWMLITLRFITVPL